MKILSIGSSILDRIAIVKTYPLPPGVQPTIDRVALGGSAANVAVALAQLGLRSAVLSTVGTDSSGDTIRQVLRDHHVDVSMVRAMQGPSGTCLCVVDAGAQRHFVHQDGVNLTIDPAWITTAVIDAVDAIVVFGYELVSPSSSAAVLHAVRLASQRGRRVYFDPSPVLLDIPLAVLDEVLAQSDYVFVNKDEAIAIGHDNDIVECAARLRARGAKTVIVKLGPNGSYLASNVTEGSTPSFATTAVDTNGAGDAFLAGFLAGKSWGMTDVQASKIANAVAAVIVQTIGAQSSRLTRSLIESMRRRQEEQLLGSLVGLTIGDTLGMPTSMMTPAEIQSTYGWVEGFVSPQSSNPIHGQLSAGESTDDTALAWMIVDEMIDHRGEIAAERLGKRLVQWADDTGALESSILGPSSTRAIQQLKDGMNARETGHGGVTNGGAMKVPPIGLIHYGNEQALIHNVVEACLPSHNTSIAMSGAMAIAFAVAAAMRQESLDQLVQTAIRGATIGQALGGDGKGPSVAAPIQRAMSLIDATKTPVDNASQIASIIGSSMATQESVPMALVYAYLANGNPREAMLLAVNMGDDADTIASMTGAITGAIQGVSSFSKEWVEAALDNPNNHLQARVDALRQLSVLWKTF